MKTRIFLVLLLSVSMLLGGCTSPLFNQYHGISEGETVGRQGPGPVVYDPNGEKTKYYPPGVSAVFVDETQCVKNNVIDLKIVDYNKNTGTFLYYYLGESATHTNSNYYCIASYSPTNQTYTCLYERTAPKNSDTFFKAVSPRTNKYLFVIGGQLVELRMAANKEEASTVSVCSLSFEDFDMVSPHLPQGLEDSNTAEIQGISYSDGTLYITCAIYSQETVDVRTDLILKDTPADDPVDDPKDTPPDAPEDDPAGNPDDPVGEGMPPGISDIVPPYEEEEEFVDIEEGDVCHALFRMEVASGFDTDSIALVTCGASEMLESVSVYPNSNRLIMLSSDYESLAHISIDKVSKVFKPKKGISHMKSNSLKEPADYYFFDPINTALGENGSLSQTQPIYCVTPQSFCVLDSKLVNGLPKSVQEIRLNTSLAMSQSDLLGPANFVKGDQQVYLLTTGGIFRFTYSKKEEAYISPETPYLKGSFFGAYPSENPGQYLVIGFEATPPDPSKTQSYSNQYNTPDMPYANVYRVELR